MKPTKKQIKAIEKLTGLDFYSEYNYNYTFSKNDINLVIHIGLRTVKYFTTRDSITYNVGPLELPIDWFKPLVEILEIK